MTDSPLAKLAHDVPGLRLLTDAADLEHYGRDWTRRWTPAPLAIALPTSIDEVRQIVLWASEQRIALVPSGGRTGLSGGAVAANGELVVSFERMTKVLGFDAVDRTLTVQPGVVLETVQRAAESHGLIYPIDFGARGSCAIGGTIATNAGGIRVIRHGMTRQWIAGLKVVTASGELLDLNRGLTKNNSGYDLRQLMIGSEGTLGLIVEATLVLADAPPPSQVMLFAIPAMDALMEVFAVCRHRLSLGAFEFFTDRALNHVVANGAQKPFAEDHPYYVVCEFDAANELQQEAALEVFAHCVEQGWASDGVIAQSDAQSSALWRLRDGITESIASHRPYKNDIAVRVSSVPAFLHDAQGLLAREYPDFEVVWFGHIGDGNLHVSVLKPADVSDSDFVEQCEHVTKLLCTCLEKHDGSISAEHGIGLVKKPYLGSTRSAAEIEWMRAIKRALDPLGILNPGKVFDA